MDMHIKMLLLSMKSGVFMDRTRKGWQKDDGLSLHVK
jgi:hypothetical protein